MQHVHELFQVRFVGASRFFSLSNICPVSLVIYCTTLRHVRTRQSFFRPVFVNVVFLLCFVSLTSFHLPPRRQPNGRGGGGVRCEWVERMDGIKSSSQCCDHEWSKSAYSLVQDGLSEIPTSSLKTFWRHRQTWAWQTAARLFLYIPFIHCSVCAASP